MKNDLRKQLKAQLRNSSILFSFSPLIFTIESVSDYIDLGTGSLIIQVLIAGFLGGLFLLKVYWRKVKAFFKNLFSKPKGVDG